MAMVVFPLVANGIVLLMVGSMTEWEHRFWSSIGAVGRAQAQDKMARRLSCGDSDQSRAQQRYVDHQSWSCSTQGFGSNGSLESEPRAFLSPCTISICGKKLALALQDRR